MKKQNQNQEQGNGFSPQEIAKSIGGILIGSAALQYHGVNIQPHDLDIIVPQEKINQVVAWIEKNLPYRLNFTESVYSHFLWSDGYHDFYPEPRSSSRWGKIDILTMGGKGYQEVVGRSRDSVITLEEATRFQKMVACAGSEKHQARIAKKTGEYLVCEVVGAYNIPLKITNDNTRLVVSRRDNLMFASESQHDWWLKSGLTIFTSIKAARVAVRELKKESSFEGGRLVVLPRSSFQSLLIAAAPSSGNNTAPEKKFFQFFKNFLK